MSGSNRFGTFTKSPLTGIWLETLLRGLVRADVVRDGMGSRGLITGAAPMPVHVHIDADGARSCCPRMLWGKDTFARPRAGSRPGATVVGALPSASAGRDW